MKIGKIGKEKNLVRNFEYAVIHSSMALIINHDLFVSLTRTAFPIAMTFLHSAVYAEITSTKGLPSKSKSVMWEKTYMAKWANTSSNVVRSHAHYAHALRSVRLTLFTLFTRSLTHFTR